MILKETKLRITIIVGLISMAVIQMMMNITDTVEAFLYSDPSFAEHLGMRGLWVTSMLIVVNIVALLLTSSAKKKWARFVVIFIIAFISGFILFHQVLHIIEGDTFDIHLIFELLHHACGVWAIINAIKWLRMETEHGNEKPDHSGDETYN